jgi:hypothetical protein
LPTPDSDTCLHLLWYYKDEPMVNSQIPLEQVPDQAPLNYLFHHHAQFHLGQGRISLQEAWADHHWHEHEQHQVQMGLETCLEVAVPWRDLTVCPDWSMQLLVVVSQAGQFVDSYPEERLIPFTVP